MAFAMKNKVFLKCHGCPQKIKNSQYMTCSVCSCTYDLFCANVSFTRYQIMEEDKKRTWKCTPCFSRQPQGNNTNTPVRNYNINLEMDNAENVTIRKPKILRQLSLDNLSLLCHTIDDSYEASRESEEKLNLSKLDVKQMKEDLDEMTNHLITAKEEINTLQKENAHLKLQIETLKDKQANNETKNMFTLKIDEPTKEKPTDIHPQANGRQFEIEDIQSKNLNKNAKGRKLKQRLNKHSNKATTGVQNKHQPKPDILRTSKTNQEVTLIPKNTSPYINKTQEINSNKTCNLFVKEPKIVIVGDESCRELAAMLITLRSKHKNTRDYRILNYTYPNAHTEHILRNCGLKNEDFDEDDWLILSLGSHDCNPIKLVMEISAFLKNMTMPHIVVTSVAYNRHLNEDKLNRELKIMTNNIRNGQFLGTLNHSRYSRQTAKHQFKTINNLINTADYKSYYLGKNITRLNKQNRQTKLKPGTIPYLFNLMNKNKTNNRKIPEVKHNLDGTFLNDANSIQNIKNAPKPGTIPFYFQKTLTAAQINTCPTQKSNQLFLV